MTATRSKLLNEITSKGNPPALLCDVNTVCVYFGVGLVGDGRIGGSSCISPNTLPGVWCESAWLTCQEGDVPVTAEGCDGWRVVWWCSVYSLFRWINASRRVMWRENQNTWIWGYYTGSLVAFFHLIITPYLEGGSRARDGCVALGWGKV